jgi:ketosteroid isomerase-like protein
MERGMPDRKTFLCIIDAVLAARTSGDKAGVAKHFADHATIRIAGQDSLLSHMTTGGGPAVPTAEALMDAFRFHHFERLDAVVEGDKAAVLWKVEVSYAGGQPVTTEIYDLWTMGADGKLTSVVQFVDTALAAKLTGA